MAKISHYRIILPFLYTGGFYFKFNKMDNKYEHKQFLGSYKINPKGSDGAKWSLHAQDSLEPKSISFTPN